MAAIVYGMPDHDLVEQSERAAVALGGCVIGIHDPAYMCPRCGARVRRREPARAMTVAFWNRHYHRRPGPQIEMLDATAWDVAVLVEVDAPMHAALRAAFGDDHVMCTLGQVDCSDMKRPHGVAFVARNGCELADLRLPVAARPDDASAPRPERFGVAIVLLDDGRSVEVIGFHAPYAAGSADNRRRKRRAYEALNDYLCSTAVWPTIVGMDGNNWGDSVPVAPPELRDDDWDSERRFHGADPAHQLKDVLREHVLTDPVAQAAAAREVAAGRPITVTYRRRHANDRMDRIYVSPDIDVDDCTVRLEDAERVGADHALVVGRVRVQ
jgi:hypothetical protein